MRLFGRIGDFEAGLGSKIARFPPWIFALLLTGCPLTSFELPGASGTTTSSGSGTSTLVGCMPASKDCEDSNPCTVDTCEDGECVYDPAPAGTPCPDTSTCNGNETCDGKGACMAGTPPAIDDGDTCTLDLCDPATGTVTHPTAPACGSWDPTQSAGAPFARTNHTAVWTGTEMLVWGGEVAAVDDPLEITASGGRYDPSTKTWKAMSTVNAPPPRHSHTAVWTGSKLLVWGGYGDTDYEVTGGAYDPATDTWTALSTVNAPEGRVQHRAVWTGTEMIVWGGIRTGALASGSRYDPAADTWTNLPQGPSPRFDHSAVWTGTEMIVWGGNDLFNWHQDGNFFEPASGWSATPTSLVDVPERRQGQVSLWTGSAMVVWGGFDGGKNLSTGGVLDPAVGSGGTWSKITDTGAPVGRQRLVGVWTGSQMMVWGGCGADSCFTTFGDGGFWSPGANGGTWTPVAEGKITTPRINATGVWTGTQVIVWGGKAGLTGKLLATGAQSEP